MKKFTTHERYLEHIGWYSTGVFLLAYLLASSKVIAADSLIYQILNLTGALGYSYFAYRRKVYQSLLANSIWAGIGIVAIIAILF